MAAVTVSSTLRESAGSLTLYVVNMSTVADTDTYASGLGSSVVGYWANGEVNEATAGDEGISVSNSSGTFTFYKKTSGAGTLFILARN